MLYNLGIWTIHLDQCCILDYSVVLVIREVISMPMDDF